MENARVGATGIGEQALRIIEGSCPHRGAHGARDSGTSTEHDKSHESRGIVLVVVSGADLVGSGISPTREGWLAWRLLHATASWTYLLTLVR